MTNWLKIEQLIRDSVTGKLIEEATALFQEALTEDPLRYKELHARIKTEEQDLLRRF